MMEREIYLVLSQTGSWLSWAIKLFTRKEYNHISLSLSQELDPMWSFGRKHPYNPLIGAFVKEYLYQGTFHRFPKTRCEVLSLKVEEEKIAEISSFLEEMYREGYGYNFIGLCFAAVNKSFPRSKKYYCSEFMSMLFHKFEIRGFDSLPALTQPCDFRNLPGVTSVYSGLMRDYPAKKENDPPMH